METCYTKKRFAQQQTNNKQRYDSTARTIQGLRYCYIFYHIIITHYRLRLLFLILKKAYPRKQVHSEYHQIH